MDKDSLTNLCYHIKNQDNHTKEQVEAVITELLDLNIRFNNNIVKITQYNNILEIDIPHFKLNAPELDNTIQQLTSLSYDKWYEFNAQSQYIRKNDSCLYTTVKYYTPMEYDDLCVFLHELLDDLHPIIKPITGNQYLSDKIEYVINFNELKDKIE